MERVSNCLLCDRLIVSNLMSIETVVFLQLLYMSKSDCNTQCLHCISCSSRPASYSRLQHNRGYVILTVFFMVQDNSFENDPENKELTLTAEVLCNTVMTETKEKGK